ncbi:hypothetical protein EG68_04310 [Paragonimus skrjabini miyazakii]|uniref:Uncharacterized protein n=1 Tax=Paragonimus skrjabini miyazakii TaxID=59628 RepID=A0A8S9YZK4_9TREM|nr:hypothetical protein EG68_04310 [Paragonimus skrjabini miyazakii]
MISTLLAENSEHLIGRTQLFTSIMFATWAFILISITLANFQNGPMVLTEAGLWQRRLHYRAGYPDWLDWTEPEDDPSHYSSWEKRGPELFISRLTGTRPAKKENPVL